MRGIVTLAAERSDRWIAVVLLFGLLLRIAAIPVSQGFTAREGDDSIHYRMIAKNLAAGHGYSSSPGAPYLPDAVREPLYPAFVAAHFAVFGEDIVPVQLTQACIDVMTLWLTYLLGVRNCRRLGRPRSAVPLAAAAALAVLPSMIRCAPLLVRETLFTFLLVVALHLALFRPSFRSAIALGAVLGIASLCRANAQLMIFALTPAVWLQLRSVPKAVALAAAALVVEACIVAPWYVRNLREFGFVGLSPTIGINLYQRTWHLAMDGGADPEIRALTRRIATEERRPADPNAMYELTVPYRVKRELKTPEPYWAIDQRFLRVALENVELEPMRYLSDTAVELAKWWFAPTNYSRLFPGFAYGPWEALKRKAVGAAGAWMVHLGACSVLLALFLVSVKAFHGRPETVALSCTVAYFGLTTALVQICYLERYWVVIAPAALLMACLGVEHLVTNRRHA